MATVNIRRDIVTKGNLAMVASGTPLYQKAGKRLHYNVAPGQLVAYIANKTGQIPTAVVPADITAANIARLRVAVGYAPKDQPGVTVALRHLGVEEIGNTEIEAINTSSPRCGQPVVKDFYFDTTTQRTYTMSVTVDDNFTRSYAPLDRPTAEYIESFVVPGKGELQAPADGDVVVKGLVDALNGDQMPTLKGKAYPDYDRTHIDRPFSATKIHTRSLEYCLAFTEPASDCEDCETVSAITHVSIDSVVYALVGTTTPGDASQTSRLQLTSIVDQINDLFDEHLGAHTGRAYLTGVGPSDCCPLQLMVNTQDASFKLQSGADPATTTITPKEDYNPFGVGKEGEGRSQGIRVIAAPLEGDCSEVVPKPLAFYNRKITIGARGEGFTNAQEITVQEMSMPAGYGGSIQYQELYQTRGGSGRAYSGGAQRGTWTGDNRADSLLKSTTAVCQEDYCSYHLRSRFHFVNPGSNKPDSLLIDSFAHMPSGDATTQADLEALLTKLASLSLTVDADAATVSCTPLQKTCA